MRKVINLNKRRCRYFKCLNLENELSIFSCNTNAAIQFLKMCYESNGFEVVEITKQEFKELEGDVTDAESKIHS